jgi:hypothetical protein
MVVTKIEIEAAAEAINSAIVGTSASEALAKLALEAAERVRPRRDPTNAMRSRQHRAKKRAERNVAGDGTSNVAEAGRNVAAERNVTRNVAGGETLPETFLAAAASGNAERMAVLFAKLVDAAGGNVQPGATDLGDITALLAQGCDLDLDILPAVRELVAAPGQPPLKSWGLPWLAKEIIRRRDARTIAADGRPQPPPPARPLRGQVWQVPKRQKYLQLQT